MTDIAQRCAATFGWDDTSTDDLAQQARLSIWRKQPTNDRHEWVVARSAIIDYIRNQPGGSRTPKKPPRTGFVPEYWHTSTTDPESEAVANDILAECPHKAVVHLTALGYSQLEIAEILGVHKTTVLARLNKVRAWLKNQ